MKASKLSLWANAAATEKSPALTGPVALPQTTARVSLWPSKSAANNPKAPVLSGNLEMSPGYVRQLIAMVQAGQGVETGYENTPVVKLPLVVSQPGGGQGLSGSIELPVSLLRDELSQGQGLQTVNQNTGEQAFKLRISVWRGDGQNPQAPVLRGSIESPSEAAAYQASKAQGGAGGWGGPAPAAAPSAAPVWGAPAAPVAAPVAAAAPAPAAAAWSAPAAAPAAPAPAAAPVAAPVAAPAPVEVVPAAAPGGWGAAPAF